MLRPVRWRTVVSGATAALAAVALTVAPASAATVSPAGCPDVPTVQPFAPWSDFADYLLAPDGGFENGAAGWTLEDGARAVEGNEPFAVGAAADHRSLALPAGARATSAPICIGVEHKTMRFFATSSRPGVGTVAVEALITKRNGNDRSVNLGSVRSDGAWAASDALPMRVNELAADYGNALSVSLRFTVRGNAAWQIDDVYVDPYRTK
jgi:hypothetical protein